MRLVLIQSVNREATQISAYNGRQAVASAILFTNDETTREGVLEAVEAFRTDPVGVFGD